MTLEQALGLLSLPRLIGVHPETGETSRRASAASGPMCGWVRSSARWTATTMCSHRHKPRRGPDRAQDGQHTHLGPHPADKEPISVRKGRFGPYVQHGKMVANLPRGVMMDDITLDEAVALLAEKGKQLRPRGAGRRGGRGGRRRSRNPLPRRRPRRRPNRPPNDGLRRPNAQRRSWRPKVPLPARRRRKRRRQRAARRLLPARQRGDIQRDSAV